MKREFKNVKRIFAVALAATLAAPTALSMNTTVVSAATLPTPVASYNFESGIEAIEGAQITNSEDIYVVKSAEELAEGEKIDANGLVYTGEGAEAKYVTKDPIGAPTVITSEDKTELNKVLQFDDTTAQIDEYQKKISAKTDDMSDETAKALDAQMPKNDYYYVESGSVAAKPLKTQNVAAQLKLSNPFAGLADKLKEYEETEDVEALKYAGKYVPKWEKGVTVSYWIKVPVDENGVYQNSSVLRWENDNEYYLQADDYSKYLPTKLWDQQYAKLDDALKEQGFQYSPSGVINYGQADNGTYNDPYGLMDFYFDYQKGYYSKDADGHLVPTMVVGNDGAEGPVYNYALIQTMQAALKGKTQFTGSARYFFANPNYQNGFYVAADGSLTSMFSTATYEEYSNLPEIVNADGTVTEQMTTSYVKLKDGQTIQPGESNIRYALEDGELQIDADDSIFWVPDDVQGINENSNVKASYGTQAGMQNADVFFMNSWTESRVDNEYNTGGTYASAAYVADSPVSKDGEKNANAGTWHHVAITMQNDWVEFYVDGEMVDVENTYSSRGKTTLDNSKSFKRFNKGAGMRNGAGSEKNMGNISYGNYVCRLFMDWISDENSVLCVGGIGNYADKYAQTTKTSKVCMDEIKFYDTVLSDEQIKALNNMASDSVVGDVDSDGKVTLTDALTILKYAVGIDTPSDEMKKIADFNGDGSVTLADTLEVLKVALGIK